jgi:hypothetical protein
MDIRDNIYTYCLESRRVDGLADGWRFITQ